MNINEKKGHCYLSLDGGFSGLPALYIIKEIFDRLAYDMDIDHEIKPCEVFRVIAGSGRGGIDALLLGRLKMTPGEALSAYLKLSGSLPTCPTISDEEIQQNDQIFVAAFTKLLESVGLSTDTSLREDGSFCSTILLTLNAANTTICEPLRTYRSRKHQTPNCTILDAARAAIASPKYFRPVVIGSGTSQRKLIDATLGRANPIKELLRQAQDHFGKDQDVASIVSIGSGKFNRSSSEYTVDVDRESFGSNAAKQAAQDCERDHREMYQRLKNFGVYFRFNVQCDGIEDSKEISETVQIKAREYLEGEEISDQVDTVSRALRIKNSNISLKRINSIEVVPTALRTPPLLVRNFVGREEVLRAIKTTHIENQSTSTTGTIITLLTGLGGVGKTQISVKFLAEYRQRFPNSAIYFVSARSKEQLEGDLQAIIRSLGDEYQSKTHTDALVWFSNVQKEWLIIYDNADDPDFNLHPYIPKSDLGHAIISSRNYDLREICPQNHQHIGGLPEDDAIELLLTSSHSLRTEKTQESAKSIVAELGYLPLAISHAASYIFRNDCLDNFLSMYKQHTKKLLAQMPKALPEDYSLSVATTIEMSFERLSPSAKDLLTLFAFFHVTGVASEVISIAGARNFDYVNFPLRTSKPAEINILADRLKNIFCPSGSWSDYDLNEILEECRHYSLLNEAKTNEGGRIYSIHLLVHTWLHCRLTQGEKQEFYQLAARVISSYISKESSHQYWPNGRVVSRHARAVPFDTAIIPEDIYQLAWIIGDWGDYQAVMVLGERVLEQLNSCPEADELQMSKVMRTVSLSGLLIEQCHKAFHWATSALKIQSALLGEEHQETLMTTEVLSNAMTQMGSYEDALRLKHSLLKKCLIILGPEHPQTVATMCSTAVCLCRFGRYEEATDLQRKSIAIRKRIYGEEHPKTLQSMVLMAKILSDQEKHSEALEIRTDITNICKKLYGEEDCSLLTALSEQTESLSAVGQFDEALKIQKHILYIRTKELGPGHPDTLSIMRNIANTFIGLRRGAEALEMYEIVLERTQAAYGAENLATIKASQCAAIALLGLNRPQEALDRVMKDFILLKEILGDDNHSTIMSMEVVADLLLKVGQDQEALRYLEKVLEMRQVSLGDGHVDTFRAMSSTVDLLKKMRGHEEAVKIYTEALNRQNIFGADNRETLQLLKGVVSSLMSLCRNQEALLYQENVLEITTRVYGPKSNDTLRALDKHSLLLVSLGRYQEALQRCYQFEKNYLLVFRGATALLRIGLPSPALEAQQDLLKKLTRMAPADYSTILQVVSEIAWCYSKLGDHRRAYGLRLLSLERWKGKIGEECSETFMAMSNVALSLFDLGKHQEALEMQETALEGMKRILGNDHPNTIAAMNRVAGALYSLDRFQEALPLVEDVVEMRRKLLGECHPYTLRAMKNLADILSKLGKGEEESCLRDQIDKIQPKTLNLMLGPKSSNS